VHIGIGTQFSSQLNSPSSFLPVQQSRTFLAKLIRKSPATAHATRTATPSVEGQASQTAAPPLQLTNLPYFIRRTSSNQLPVYLVTKAGGTKQLTKIQRTEGDLEALRTDLGRALGLECRKSKKINDVTINQLNGHIIVKVRVLRPTKLFACVPSTLTFFCFRVGGNPRYKSFSWSGTSEHALPGSKISFCSWNSRD
jgi:large subunit ribosomal protein L49